MTCVLPDAGMSCTVYTDGRSVNQAFWHDLMCSAVWMCLNGGRRKQTRAFAGGFWTNMQRRRSADERTMPLLQHGCSRCWRPRRWPGSRASWSCRPLCTGCARAVYGRQIVGSFQSYALELCCSSVFGCNFNCAHVMPTCACCVAGCVAPLSLQIYRSGKHRTAL